MKKLKISFQILLLAVVMASCSDSFLDLKQPIDPTLETYYTDTATAYKGLVGCYNSLQQYDRAEAPNLINFHLDIRSDDIDYGGDPKQADQTNNSMFANFIIFSDNSLVSQFWASHFWGITTTTKYLEGISDLKLSATQQVLVEQYRAEAKFIRAYMFFKLVRAFGGVPVITESLAPSKWYEQRRATEAEVYAQIYKDLREAIPVLPLKSAYTTAQTHRISKGAAQALLAKALITEAGVNATSPNWTEAYNLCKEVETSAKYNLNTAFKDIWGLTGQFTSESVFDIVYNPDIKSENDSYNHYMSPRFVFKGNNPDDSEKMKYGFGVTCVTQELASEFGYTPNGYTASAALQKADSLAYVKMNDGRGRYTFWARWDTYGGVRVVDELNTRPQTKNTVNTDDGAYMTRKYNRPAPATAGYADIVGTNYHVIRYAEVLLLGAEAAYYKGDAAEARRLVNLVRERAFRDAIADSRVTLDAIKITSSGNQLLQDIWRERRLELAGEGERFYDLKRTNRLSILKVKKPEILFQEGKHELLPVPSTELTRAPYITQNPNY
jgi:hypothetical protein